MSAHPQKLQHQALEASRNETCNPVGLWSICVSAPLTHIAPDVLHEVQILQQQVQQVCTAAACISKHPDSSPVMAQQSGNMTVVCCLQLLQAYYGAGPAVYMPSSREPQ